MDCEPLNLAHFHERRANRFLHRHRYDEAVKALETSLLYLQDAFKTARLPKAIEVLNTQRWDYERKLQHIQMHKQQHERLKHKEIVPLSATNSSAPLLRNESNVTAQSLAKSIDKTVNDFNEKQSLTQRRRNASTKENQSPRDSTGADPAARTHMVTSEPMTQPYDFKDFAERPAFYLGEHEEIPSLAPLELPTFDTLATSTPALTNLAEGFSKE